MANDALKERWRHIIFGTDSLSGRIFDQLLIIAIVVSVLAIILDSIEPIHAQYGHWLYLLEWCFTILFTIEYAIRLYVIDRPLRYARSFFGLVDLLSVLPTYLSLFIPGSQYMLTIRALRVLRIFRVLKLASFMKEASTLTRALLQARRKVMVFMFSVLVVIIIFGSLMYVVEGPERGFTSIPVSIYWAIVTVTTVGYGDISPQTPFGQVIAAMAMITGYAIIAVPTGIVTAEISSAIHAERFSRECPHCHLHDHQRDARFCRACGNELPKNGDS